jgi:hypothetical protein
MTNEPHASRFGWLKNNNPPGDPSTAPRCGARTRAGEPCKSAAMRSGRCRMHGGASTGPRTPEGLARSKRATWKHGRYSAEHRAARREARAAARAVRWLCSLVDERQG